MEVYERLYFFLFNAITDALEAIDSGLIAEAAEALRDAQCTAEELYIQRADWQKADDRRLFQKRRLQTTARNAGGDGKQIKPPQSFVTAFLPLLIVVTLLYTVRPGTITFERFDRGSSP